MACERPVLVTTRGGGREAVLEGKTGFVIDPAHPEQWRRRLEWCIGHPQELENMGRKARLHMQQSFPISMHIDWLLREYGKVAAIPA